MTARSVAYTDPREGGTSGIYLIGVLERFGIADVVTRKAVLSNGGRAAVEKVAQGEAEIAVTLISEIVPVKGAKLAGPVPPAVQLYTVYAAAIPASSTDRRPSSPRSPDRRWRRAGGRRASSRRNSASLRPSGSRFADP